MFLVRHSLYNPSFCSDSTNTDSNRFFVKLSLLVKFIWYCMSVLFSFYKYIYIYFSFFFVTAESFPECARTKKKNKKKKNEIQCLCRLCLNAIIRLWFTADTQVFLGFSSIAGYLHRKCLFFNICICAMLAQIV